MVPNPWVQVNPLNQQVYQLFPQLSPQQTPFPPYVGGPQTIRGPTGIPMPYQYYQPQLVNH